MSVCLHKDSSVSFILSEFPDECEFTSLSPIGKAGTTVMRRMALVARMKLLSSMAATGSYLGPEIRSSECLHLSYSLV